MVKCVINMLTIMYSKLYIRVDGAARGSQNGVRVGGACCIYIHGGSWKDHGRVETRIRIHYVGVSAGSAMDTAWVRALSLTLGV